MSEMESLIKDIVEASGAVTEDIKMSETGGTIKVICDTEEGITSETLVRITRNILQDPRYDEGYAGRYSLEVSSPGVDAPLTLPRHFRKNTGREIELFHSCDDCKDPLTGTILEADDTILKLEVLEKKEKKILVIPMEKVKHARIRLKW